MTCSPTGNAMRGTRLRCRREAPRYALPDWVTLSTCGAALFWFQSVNFRKSFVAELQSPGAVVAQNSSAPLAFDNTRSAEEVLSSLKVRPQITSAWIIDQQGKHFASFGPQKEPDPVLTGVPVGPVTFSDGNANLGIPIPVQDAAPGRLQIRANYQQEYRKLLGLIR